MIMMWVRTWSQPIVPCRGVLTTAERKTLILGFFGALMVHVIDTSLVAYILIHLLRKELQINTLHGSSNIVDLDYV
jgi:hypothetical protein